MDVITVSLNYLYTSLSLIYFDIKKITKETIILFYMPHINPPANVVFTSAMGTGNHRSTQQVINIQYDFIILIDLLEHLLLCPACFSAMVCLQVWCFIGET